VGGGGQQAAGAKAPRRQGAGSATGRPSGAPVKKSTHTRVVASARNWWKSSLVSSRSPAGASTTLQVWCAMQWGGVSAAASQLWRQEIVVMPAALRVTRAARLRPPPYGTRRSRPAITPLQGSASHLGGHDNGGGGDGRSLRLVHGRLHLGLRSLLERLQVLQRRFLVRAHDDDAAGGPLGDSRAALPARGPADGAPPQAQHPVERCVWGAV
jgi:hypothetical protein